MKTEFMVAITQLSAEKNLSVDLVLSAVESALVSAYKKSSFSPEQDIIVKISPNTGGVKVYLKQAVVDKVQDPKLEIKLTDARKVDRNARVGDIINIESTPPDAGRIAIQTARQVILQRLHEAEHHAIFEEFTVREGEVVTGMIQRVTPEQIYVDLGKAEGILPRPEQVHNERYRTGQRLKLYLMEVSKTARGPQIILSRAHRNLLRKLFELEVPEIHAGAVEIKAVAREAGFRSKVAVAARQEGIDPVGCCVGLRGIRIQNIVNELNDEKIDVVQWSEDSRLFIANSLSPAQVSNVELNVQESTAMVVVPDKQLSLAIGKDGQNARLAAKLTGWRIDIKSLSAYEKERAELAAREAPPVEAGEPLKQRAKTRAKKTVKALEGLMTEPVGAEQAEAAPVKGQAPQPQPVSFTDIELVLTRGKRKQEEPATTQIRFAEDILPSKTSARKKTKEADGKEKVKTRKLKGKQADYNREEEYEE